MRSARVIALFSILTFHLARIAGAEGVGDARITVVAVRIFVNDIRYDWREGSQMPDRAQGGYTEPSTVASFLGVRTGEKMRAGELEYRRRRAEERLTECGYFYAAHVLAVPASSRADGRLVVVKVREGFLWRFGGGPYFASIGQANVFGAAKSWNAYAGYNRAGVSWRDDAVLGGPFVYEIGFLYINKLGTGFLDYHCFMLPLSVGVRLTPDSILSPSSPLTYRCIEADASPAMSVFPDTADGLEWTPGISLDWGTAVYPAGMRISFCANGSAGLSLASTCASHWRVEGEGFMHVVAWPEIHLRASAGAAIPISMGLPVFALFDLETTPARAIRAGYDTSELLAARYAMASAEIRFPLPRIPLGSIFSLSLAPFLYADAALTQMTWDGAMRDLEGFGLGVRIGFENPIFAYFSLSYGWNPRGTGRFCFFAASADQ